MAQFELSHYPGGYRPCRDGSSCVVEAIFRWPLVVKIGGSAIGILCFLQLIKDELLPEKWEERLRLLNLLPPRPWYIWVILLLVIAPVGGLEGVVRIRHDRWLGSLTTPVNPPDVVVCAFSSLAKESSGERLKAASVLGATSSNHSNSIDRARPEIGRVASYPIWPPDCAPPGNCRVC